MFKTSLVYSLIVASVIGTINSPAKAISFSDSFDDGVVDSRYTSLGGATLAEESGKLSIRLNSPNDGLNINLADLAVNCFKIAFKGIGFSEGQGISIDLFATDSISNEIPFFSISIVKDTAFVDNSTLSNLQAVNSSLFNNTKQCVVNVIISNQVSTFPVPCEEDLSGSFQADVTDGLFNRKLRWKYDGRDPHAPNTPRPVIKRVIDLLNNNIFPVEKLTNVNVKFVTVVVKDPLLEIDYIEAEEVHVPEPSSYLGIFALGTLGTVAVLKHGSKLSKFTKNQLE